MGCKSSKPKGGTASVGGNTANGAAPSAPKEYSWDKQKKLDPKDFTISKQEGVAITKVEGSIDGQQFIIEECKDCDIFILDWTATISLDYCENCRVFVGPVESSIFIRNCKGCDMVIACQQFRSRDCENCRFALFSMTEPVVETSRNMEFACFDFFYFTLKDQFKKAKLKIWNNKWWQVHDFNKNMQESNWRLFPQQDVSSMLRLAQCTGIAENESGMDKVVPVTLGSRDRTFNESCILIFLPQSEAYVEAFLAKAYENSATWHMCRTRAIILDEDRAKQLFAWSKEPIAKQIKGQEIVGIEVGGNGVFQQVTDMLTKTGLAAGAKQMKQIPQKDTTTLGKLFF